MTREKKNIAAKDASKLGRGDYPLTWVRHPKGSSAALTARRQLTLSCAGPETP